MIGSLAIVFILGLTFAYIANKLGLPRLVGMLLAGIIIGPFGLNLLDDALLLISSQLRSIALIIILIKAGLSLKFDDIRQVGLPALLLSFLPATFEWLAYVVVAPLLLGISWVDAAILGAVIAAVSPAVVVPRMVDLMDHNIGTEKKIPQMILAGASLDDVFVIVLFTSFLGMSQSGSLQVSALMQIPSSIGLGLVFGGLGGFFLVRLFAIKDNCSQPLPLAMKALLLLAASFLMYALEQWCKPYVAISGLLAVMSMAMIVGQRLHVDTTKRLQTVFGDIWVGAEVLLFVLVGSAVDISYTLHAGLMAVVMLFIGLLIRCIGVWLSLLSANLSNKEKLYCIVAYCPKATVQAAIGAIPLSLGLSCGNIILSCAVLSILISAPLGAFGMDYLKSKCFVKR